MPEPLRDQIRAKAREKGLDISAVEIEPTELDVEAMLVDVGRQLRRAEPSQTPDRPVG